MKAIDSLSTNIIHQLGASQKGLVTAESCTGGLIIGALTDVSGASAVIDRSFITYSNNAKHELLAVKNESLATYGAVSDIVAGEMAAGALTACPSAHYSIAVTGIAGPGGGTDKKPVGLVYIAIGALQRGVTISEHHFDGDRHAIRLQTVEAALKALLTQIED